MKSEILDTAIGLSDQALLARVQILAAAERGATAELVAHLAALELRRSLYAAQGHGSLFAYCTQALRLSEDAACRRIDVARLCRRFPAILELLAMGAMSVTTVRLVGPLLTVENHGALLARASHKGKTEVEALVAELAPRPDVPASVRKLPGRALAEAPSLVLSVASAEPPASVLAASSADSCPAGTAARIEPEASSVAAMRDADAQGVAGSGARLSSKDRPVLQMLAPERYRVQFTIGQGTHEKLREMQALLRRQVPSGDPAAIFEMALDALKERVEKARFGGPLNEAGGEGARSARQTKRGDRTRLRASYDFRIRSSADESASSRHIPAPVKRAVWRRDDGRCAFVATGGVRCTERSFLEFHHIRPYALDGPTTVSNLSLRCRRHNAYEAELAFGATTSSRSRGRDEREGGKPMPRDRQGSEGRDPHG